MTLTLLPDEVLADIFFCVDDPTPLIACRRLLHLSQDPYVRAHYFLTRYGRIQALYFAFCRAKLVTPRVLDILISSGAHLSRYFVQVAFHHFFHCNSHFLKIPWVRNISWDAWNHFMTLAVAQFHEIPRGKNEDDGTIFTTFIKEAKFPAEAQSVSWEVIRDMFEKYLFIPFCQRDPLMVQLPLVLAIEPRLLPYAVANGFEMDEKYRDFVFRKMFEKKTSTPIPAHADEIAANVRELCRLDSHMFVTRTVAAEVCLEVKTNEAAYRALKQLDRTGDLPFSLADLVQDVIKLFVKARAITTAATTQILTQLYTDFFAPSPTSTTSVSSYLASSRTPPIAIDPAVRRAMYLTVFAADPPIAGSAIASRLTLLGLGPMSLKDAADVLTSAFVEKPAPLFEYLRREGVADESNMDESGSPSKTTRKVTNAEFRTLAEDVAVRCLTLDSKGKTLKRLSEMHSTVRTKIVQSVLGEHEIRLEHISLLGEVPDGQERLKARLSRSMGGFVVGEDVNIEEGEPAAEEEDGAEGQNNENEEDFDMESATARENGLDGEAQSGQAQLSVDSLGRIGIEPLSTMIRRDEQGARSRRRYYYHAMPWMASSISSRTPVDSLSVAKWIKTEFKAFSSITATFLTHAVINGSYSVLSAYLDTATVPVPITLKHFQALAQLGRSTADFHLYERIREGAPFYRTEEDYLGNSDVARFLLKKLKGKDKGQEGQQPQLPTQTSPRVKAEPVELTAASPSPRKRKRPRRSATAVDYAVPDSDDEAIAAEEDMNDEFAEYRLGSLGGGKMKAKADIKVAAPKADTDLALWIKALEELNKEEQRKYREKKKRIENERAAVGANAPKIRVSKSDFFRSLTTNLRSLRELNILDHSRRQATAEQFEVTDDEDEDYVQTKAPKLKRRKTTLT
ncbi:hypothetical protein R3P38DRAFT_2868905 [Favolaschia claudopus]|uniref:F-box domain-containing protein n=1 Tax=Favolaschia claudopus TaxID=2862362 RepID=A0AAW0DBV9_9AGAR